MSPKFCVGLWFVVFLLLLGTVRGVGMALWEPQQAPHRLVCWMDLLVGGAGLMNLKELTLWLCKAEFYAER